MLAECKTETPLCSPQPQIEMVQCCQGRIKCVWLQVHSVAHRYCGLKFFSRQYLQVCGWMSVSFTVESEICVSAPSGTTEKPSKNSRASVFFAENVAVQSEYALDSHFRGRFACFMGHSPGM
jgi:hypothetical protein